MNSFALERYTSPLPVKLRIDEFQEKGRASMVAFRWKRRNMEKMSANLAHWHL